MIYKVRYSLTDSAFPKKKKVKTVDGVDQLFFLFCKIKLIIVIVDMRELQPKERPDSCLN